MRTRTKALLGLSIIGLAGLCTWQIRASAADNPGFPLGLDAVQPAPGDLPSLRVEIEVAK